MSEWFEEIDAERKNVVCSRVRLTRNWDEYVFPSRLDDGKAAEMIRRLCEGMKDIDGLLGLKYDVVDLSQLGELELRILREHRVLNSSIIKKKAPMAMLLSEDESVSLVLNGADHIRIQVLRAGLHMADAWKMANEADDYVGSRFSYAFDEKYGYLTSFPTNVGTGLRAAAIVHLPSLSLGKKFPLLVSDMARFGVLIRGICGEGRENYGALYEISNQKTMGQSEQEIVDMVSRVAAQLDDQENQVREMAMKTHRLVREDELYKSYGVLKYARRLSMKEAMSYLSQIMAGTADGLIRFSRPVSVPRLILGIQTANLQNLSDKPLDKDELDAARAEYLREELPQLC